MKNKTLIAALVASAYGLAAHAESAKSGSDAVVATVNGKTITQGTVDSMSQEISQRRGAGGGAIPQDKIVEDLIKRELLRQEAESQNLAKDPKYAARLENAERMALSQAAAEDFMAKTNISDDAVKQEYDKRIASMSSTEYKARHILVEKEQEAKDIIKKLEKKEKFADLAKKLTKDPSGKGNGGDLGWFNPQQMVPPFSEAVKNLKNGEYSKTPVQTQFGWHVILREESREQAPPPLDQVKDQLKQMLQAQKLQDHIAELTSKAKIEKKTPPPAAEDSSSKLPDTSLEAGKPGDKKN